MRRNKKSVWTRIAPTICISAAIGLVTTFMLTMLFAAFTFFLMDSMSLMNFFSFAALCVGGIVAGYFCGHRRRRKGIFEGLLCGAVMFIFLCVAGIFAGAGLGGIKLFLRLTVSGAVGGVCGVNSRLKTYG